MVFGVRFIRCMSARMLSRCSCAAAWASGVEGGVMSYPGAERPAVASQRHDANVRVVVGPLQAVNQLVLELTAERVELLRPVQPDSLPIPSDAWYSMN